MIGTDTSAASRKPVPDTEPQPRDDVELSNHPLRRGILIALLGAVVAVLGVYCLTSSLHNSRAATRQQHAIDFDGALTGARHNVSQQQLYLQQYVADPRPQLRAQYLQASSNATTALEHAVAIGIGRELADAQRLLAEQMMYRDAAARLLSLVAVNDPAVAAVYSSEVTPSWTVLHGDVDAVVTGYHAASVRAGEALRVSQARTLTAVIAWFALAVLLVVAVWLLVLGYQRRLTQQADRRRHESTHDALTGLPNRSAFYGRLNEALQTAMATPGERFAVLMIDLNGLKAVNDTLGHQAGDELLALAGRRLRGALHHSDLVARFAGDEFAVLLYRIPDPAAARSVAQRLAQKLNSDFMLSSGPAAVSAAIGVALGPGEHDAETLVRHADSAIHRAVGSSRGVALYDAEADMASQDRLSLFGQLRGVLDSGDQDQQLVLYFQPQVRISDGAVAAVAALVRWRHPQRGVLRPTAFLPLAGSGRLELQLTYHLLRVAVHRAQHWHTAGEDLVVAVPTSARCLLDEEFVHEVLAALKLHDTPPQLLRLELEEDALIRDPERCAEVLAQLSAKGLGVSVDGFGTGFSSLSALRRFPVDRLKIDAGVMLELAASRRDVVLVRSAIELVHSLGLLVVADRVERRDWLPALADLGCDYVAGYALSRPVPAELVPSACREAQQQVREMSGSSAGKPDATAEATTGVTQ